MSWHCRGMVCHGIVGVWYGLGTGMAWNGKSMVGL